MLLTVLKLVTKKITSLQHCASLTILLPLRTLSLSGCREISKNVTIASYQRIRGCSYVTFMESAYVNSCLFRTAN